MKTEHLYYFKCLAEVLNYTQASQKLYIGQSTLSAVIKSLESEIGATLFERSKGSPIKLTEPAFVSMTKLLLPYRLSKRVFHLQEKQKGQLAKAFD